MTTFKNISDSEYMRDKISCLRSYFNNFSTLLQNVLHMFNLNNLEQQVESLQYSAEDHHETIPCWCYETIIGFARFLGGLPTISTHPLSTSLQPLQPLGLERKYFREYCIFSNVLFLCRTKCPFKIRNSFVRNVCGKPTIFAKILKRKIVLYRRNEKKILCFFFVKYYLIRKQQRWSVSNTFPIFSRIYVNQSLNMQCFFFIFLFFRGIFSFSFVLYSALLHLPPLRFHCADGFWDRTQDRCNWCIGSQTL